MTRVGIPRSLLYYQYYPMWKAFFENLGAEVVLSPTTTQSILRQGSARLVIETCLPVKVFCGHVVSLTDKCDFIFIPAVRSVRKKDYNCAKFLGLPDMMRAVVRESPPVLDTEIDINRGQRHLYQAIYDLGKHFTRKKNEIKRAAEAAWQTHLRYQTLMSARQISPPEAISEITGRPVPALDRKDHQLTIALIGHPYLLYDDHINYRILHRLELAHCRVMTPEMLLKDDLDSAVNSLTGGLYWTFEHEVVGAGEYFLKHDVDGIISVMAFGCGPDSVMMDMVQRQARRLKTPFMSLTLDEHTAEAGIITRLEAFLDMIYRRERKQVKV